jgi:hypothetical protein
MPSPKTPAAVAAISRKISEFLALTDDQARVIGNAKYGVYAFYDYDSEPIYVGQTSERLRVRIRRHLTNQRTDAVAMNVLDPAEVAEIEVWPLFDLGNLSAVDAANKLSQGEYTVFQQVLQSSALGAVLNEKDIQPTDPITLPPSFRRRIIPEDIYEQLKHPDVRIARRASTIANLARVISERDVSNGLRKTLVTQAQRLERLARSRLNEISGTVPVEEPGEETGD